MELDLEQQRQEAHALLDLLPAAKLNVVKSLLELMVEPLSGLLGAATVEDEEVTPGTADSVNRARASLERGEAIPHEEILLEFGLSR